MSAKVGKCHFVTEHATYDRMAERGVAAAIVRGRFATDAGVAEPRILEVSPVNLDHRPPALSGY